LWFENGVIPSPQKAYYVLKALSLAGDTNERCLDYKGTNSINDEFIAKWAIRRWSLVGGSRSLGNASEGYVTWTLHLSVSLFLSLSLSLSLFQPHLATIRGVALLYHVLLP
jgi:hypothetical protein